MVADAEYNCFPATITELIPPRESYYLLEISCGIRLHALATEQEIKEKGLALGQVSQSRFVRQRCMLRGRRNTFLLYLHLSEKSFVPVRFDRRNILFVKRVFSLSDSEVS